MQIVFRWLCSALVLCVSLSAAEVGDDDEMVALTLPPQVEMGRLIDMVGELAGVSVEYNPQRVHGAVKLDLRTRYTPAELWSVFNQVLHGHDLTTVVAGDPPLYHVVGMNEAAALARVLSPEEFAEVTPSPGYASVMLPLDHLPPETAVQALGNMLGQGGQARSLGRGNDHVLLAGPSGKVEDALRALTVLDAPGLQPAFRQYQPRFAAPGKLQAAATAAWNAAGRVSGRQTPMEVQLTPDGRRLLIIAPASRIDELEALLRELDQSEPNVTRTYRPQHFSIDDVGDLVERILASDAAAERVDLVRDHLTGALVVSATVAQHERVARIVADLDQAPDAARRSMRQITVKHRAVADLVAVLRELLQQGMVAPGSGDTETGSRDRSSAAGDDRPRRRSAEGQPPAIDREPPVAEADVARPESVPAADDRRRPAATGDGAVVLSTDELTNTLIAFGAPRMLDQIEALIAELDVRQPQVELELTLLSLNETESMRLGIELVGEKQAGSLEGDIASLFGVSTPGNLGLAGRTLGNFSGLGGLIINPGDWAVAFNALETMNEGRNMVTSRVVVDNAAEAQVDGVDQQPVSATSSNDNAAITGFGGTSDAGTQLTITPQIGAADQVTLTYSVSQSVFTGESITTGDGAVLPPPRSANTFSSVATVPDGHVIALGGLVNQRDSQGHSGLPWIARIPVLGIPFRNRSEEQSASRFFVFIRVNVLRNGDFADLKHLSAPRRAEAGIDDGWPTLTPRFLD